MNHNSGKKKIRSVDQYLDLLKNAKKSAITLRNYRQILKQFAEFLKVPLEDLHKNLAAEDLVRYAAAISDRRGAGRSTTLSTIHRYMELNGIEFDELEYNVAKVRKQDVEERDDKPLTLKILQGMMDQGKPHGRALLSFLISTGCRAGETSKIQLSDVGRIENGKFVSDINGDVVQIRNEYAKRKKGGLVFLTAEAREYLTVWLNDRDRYITDADMRTQHLYTATTRHEKVPRKDVGKQIKRADNDQRLFASSYATIDKTFGRLYRAVDGERGESGAKITAHACRAYFRTHGAKTLGIDLAEGILRHTGYLNAEYVRMTPEDRLAQFHEGESVLYITRADHRIQGGKLDALERDNKNLQEQLNAIQRMQEIKVRIEDTDEFKAEIQKYKNWKESQK
jgi:integrase